MSSATALPTPPLPTAVDKRAPPPPPVPAAPALEWPSALVPHGLSRYSGLTAATDVAEKQAAANRKADARAQRSSMAGLTLRVALEDMRAALVGIPADLYERRGRLSLRKLLRGDRLRGAGLLLVVVALLALLLL
jgi:hypothetical protein